MRDIYEIHGELLDVCESLKAFDTAFGILREHYNVDDDTEIFHWLVIFQGSIRNVIGEIYYFSVWQCDRIGDINEGVMI